MIVIPRAPERVHLPIDRSWDDRPLEAGRAASAELWLLPEGSVRIAASFPELPKERIPGAPPGSRVANLWEFDVIELFFVFDPAERYLEVEIGPRGHFLALSFDGIRQRSREHERFRPKVLLDGAPRRVEIEIPPELFDGPLRALNAFAILDGEHHAHSAMPGPQPDYHQPTRFPPAGLAP
jgi:hypothetical protein